MKWLLDLILSFFSRLGKAEQKAEEADAGMEVIARANEAARKVEQEENGAPDPNDRDSR